MTKSEEGVAARSAITPTQDSKVTAQTKPATEAEESAKTPTNRQLRNQTSNPVTNPTHLATFWALQTQHLILARHFR